MPKLHQPMRRICLAATLLLAVLLALPAQAAKRPDFGPFYRLTYDLWYIGVDGHMRLEGGDTLQVPGDVNFTEGTNINSWKFEIRNLGPYVPTLRLGTYKYFFEQGINRDENFNYGGVTFSHDGARARLDVFAVGASAIYTYMPVAGLHLDYGLEIRRFASEVRVSGEDANTRQPVEVNYDITGEIIGYLPLLHLGPGYYFRRLPLIAKAEVQIIKISDYEFIDASGYVEYKVWHIKLGAGYRDFIFGGTYETEESDIEMRVKGSFMRVGVDF